MTKTYIIYTVVAIIATALSFIYSYYSVKLARDGFNDRDIELNEDNSETFMLRWINSALFSIGQIFMSLTMMCLLRVRFANFYAEYGCILWTAVTVQALSLLT